MGVVQFLKMAGTHSKSDFDTLAQKALLDFRFQQQIETGAGEQKFWYGARITQLAPPGPTVVGAGFQQTALLQVSAPVIITEEVATIDRLRQRSIVPERGATVI